MPLQTRRPTGAKAAPVILLEGEEGAGKSYAAALLSASPRVGRTFWLQLGRERTADEYARITHPQHGRVRYDIVVHGRDYPDVLQAIQDTKAQALEDLTATGRPDVVVLDTIGSMWEMLSEWTDNRARASEKNRQILLKDPNAEIDVSSNYWNDATSRWRRLMTPLLTFPGIVVLLSRGRETIYMEGGRPINNKADYRVEGQKQLTFDVSAWVRMERDLGFDSARIVKLNSVDRPITAPTPGTATVLLRRAGQVERDFSLERFIFDTMGYDPATANHHGVMMLHAGSDAPLSDAGLLLEQKIREATTENELRDAYQAMIAAAMPGPEGRPARISPDERRQLSTLARTLKDTVTPAPPAEDAPPPPAPEPTGATIGARADDNAGGNDETDPDQLGGVRTLATATAG